MNSLLPLAQVIVIVFSAQLGGMLAEKLGQSKVVGEIVAGALLGPSLFGWLAPGAYHALFSPYSPGLPLFGEVGLILLMFMIGMEFDRDHLKIRQNHALAFSVAAAGIVTPFLLGLAIAYWSHPVLAPTQPFVGYALFIGIALSVTAVPVLVRMVQDLGIVNLHVSRIAIMSAAVTDVIAWLLLAIATTLAKTGAFVDIFVRQLFWLGVYAGVCYFIVRPLLHRLLDMVERQEHKTRLSPIAVLLIAALLSGLGSSAIGFHSAFGGLVMGLLVSERQSLAQRWRKEAGGFLNIFLVPLFFALAGSGIDLGSIGIWNGAPWFLIFLVAAILGKFGASYIAARAGGLPHQHARFVGLLMNTRGLMELIVLTIGRDMGLIPTEVYSILMLMAIFTTMMTIPVARLWLPRLLLSSNPSREPAFTKQGVAQAE